MLKKTKNIIIIVLYLIFYLFILKIFLKNDFTVEYYIKSDKTFYIKETYTENKDNGKYKYSVLFDNTTFKFQVFNKNGKNQLIKQIYYYSDENYECILPIFDKNEILIDMICYDKLNYSYYHNIEYKTQQMKDFVNNIKEYNLSINLSENSIDGMTYYNIDNEYSIALTNYKGIYNFNSGYKNIAFFKNDIYDAEISGFYNEYYYIADYSQTYEFDKIYVYDFAKNKKHEIIYPQKISFNSYIQGINDGKIYLYDITNKKQYMIDLDNKLIEKVGDENKGIKIYRNNNWEDITISSACDKSNVFQSEYEQANFDSVYERIDINTQSGYYYFYKKVDNEYKVYRSMIDDIENKIYLYSTSTIDRVKYINNEVYYIDNNILKCYKDTIGEQKLIYFKELEFNKSIKFGVYKKSN